MSESRVTTEELLKLYAEMAVEEEAVVSRRVLGREEAHYAASQWGLMWRKFIRNRAAIVGGMIVVTFYLLALFADFLSPYTPALRSIKAYMPPQRIHFFHDGKFEPFVYGIVRARDPNTFKLIYTEDTSRVISIRFFHHAEPYKLFGLLPTDVHLFGVEAGEGEEIVSLLGTDNQGRDLFSRILLGSQISLTIGLAGVLLSLLIGAVLGVASGYYGGWIDNSIQRLIEVVRAFPSIPLWMALTAALPPHWPPLRVYFAITVILSLVGWTWLARQLRGKVLALREEDFVLAAKLAGASDWRIIIRHLIPATLSHTIVISTLAMPGMILAESALSFLGLGIRAPLTSWGVLLQEAQNVQTIALYPWLLIPGLFVATAVLAFNFLGDGIRDASDPYTV
jgi:peptide/nickel transport system permease protein